MIAVPFPPAPKAADAVSGIAPALHSISAAVHAAAAILFFLCFIMNPPFPYCFFYMTEIVSLNHYITIMQIFQ
jgi:hypothetical protein